MTELNKYAKYQSVVRAMVQCNKYKSKAGYISNYMVVLEAIELDLYTNKKGSSLYLPFYIHEPFVLVQQQIEVR